jgi:hypothetical protein
LARHSAAPGRAKPPPPRTRGEVNKTSASIQLKVITL